MRAQDSFQVVLLHQNLSFPAGIAFASDGTMYFTEREGRVRRVVNGQLDPQPVASGPTSTSGETGFLGIEVAPPPNEAIYVFATDPGGESNRILRVPREGGQLQPVLTDLPGGSYHNGGGIAFDEAGNLFISNGEIHHSARSQDPIELGGKVYRVTPAGEPVPDNPFGPNSMTYALGLRNPFGLTIDPVSGDPFVTENGPEANDEVNHIVAEGNYGWPAVQGTAGDMSVIEATLEGRYQEPLLDYPDIIVPTGLAFAPPGEARPKYAGDLFFGTYGERTIHRVQLDDDRNVVSDEVFLQERDPVVALEWGPDGLYYSTPSTIKVILLAKEGEIPSAAQAPPPSPEEPGGVRIDRILIGLAIAGILAVLWIGLRRRRTD